MFENAVPLNSEIHANQNFKPPQDFSYARNVLSAPLALSEVVQASREFPIVFPTSGKFVPVAQMGYRKDGNLYVSEDGHWTARYTPAHLRRYPFALGEQGDAGKYIMMVEPAALTTQGGGEALFEGGNTPEGGIVDRARKFLVHFQKELDQTEAFFKPLQQADVLVPRSFNVQRGDEQIGQVKGLQVVDKERLAACDDELLAKWVRSGLLGMIDAHLHSLDNWNSQKPAMSSNGAQAN